MRWLWLLSFRPRGKLHHGNGDDHTDGNVAACPFHHKVCHRPPTAARNGRGLFFRELNKQAILFDHRTSTALYRGKRSWVFGETAELGAHDIARLEEAFGKVECLPPD